MLIILLNVQKRRLDTLQSTQKSKFERNAILETFIFFTKKTLKQEFMASQNTFFKKAYSWKCKNTINSRGNGYITQCIFSKF